MKPLAIITAKAHPVLEENLAQRGYDVRYLPTVTYEALDAMIQSVGNVNIALGIDLNPVWLTQLAALVAPAVGAACGANPLPLFLPCHRVIGAENIPSGERLPPLPLVRGKIAAQGKNSLQLVRRPQRERHKITLHTGSMVRCG